MIYKIRVVVVLALAASFSLNARAQAPTKSSAPYRVAVLVGSNEAAPGRKKLRYSHDDVKSVARVLNELGGYTKMNTYTLLDPEPLQVLATLDRALKSVATAGNNSMLFFYYSGHADDQAIYPKGKYLSVRELLSRLDRQGPTVRIGVVDACRGGNWTGTKGLKKANVFEIQTPLTLETEGSILISSSSGLEDAHESESVGGSYFTHHWTMGLRGAADRDRDSRITLTEAFDYAKAQTIRDTAAQSLTPQHPSFLFNLRGRHDLALTQLSQNTSRIKINQTKGPLELVDLQTGVVLLSTPEGKRDLDLAVPTGKYLVRRKLKAGYWSKEFDVKPGGTSSVAEDANTLSANVTTAKDMPPRPTILSTLPKHKWNMQLAAGVIHGIPNGAVASGSTGFSLLTTWNFGITHRWQWLVPYPAFAYRGGEFGEFEWIPFGGLTGWGLGYFRSPDGTTSSKGFIGALSAGIDLRSWMNNRSSFQFSTRVASLFLLGDESIAPRTWQHELGFVYSYTVADTVTFNVGLEWRYVPIVGGHFSDSSSDLSPTLTVGSSQTRALRSLPLMQIHLSDVFSIDFYTAVGYKFERKKFVETYMAGVSWLW